MARMSILALLFAGALAPAWPQAQTDEQLKQAGVCARCHVISVVEWGISRHQKAGTDCIACHGTSVGHVRDERNNIKPDRMPHGEAVTALCATCHSAKKGSCQTCHHVHALVDPKKPPSARDERLEQLKGKWQSAARHVAEGERLAALGQWEKARAEFKAALAEQPENRIAADRVKLCDRRLATAFPGFEPAGKDRDAATGLPREVRIAGLGIAMVLVPGGDADIGSDRFAAAKPVHTVSVAPFYLAKYEVTQAEWKSLMGANPSANHGDRMPVEQISWEDAQAFIRKLNERVPGGGFRLPTEAEWEFAARAGEPVSGDAPAPAAAPVAVGSKQPDKLGLFDMQGNVWEWCSSLYTPYPYVASDGRESRDGSGLRVLRGGGFADTADLLDPANRHGERAGRRLRWNGMRIARSVPEE
jgi:formylglycine-generating enzyme required for sulfatase activity